MASALNGHAERLARGLPAASTQNGRAERLARHLEAAAKAQRDGAAAANGHANGHAGMTARAGRRQSATPASPRFPTGPCSPPTSSRSPAGARTPASRWRRSCTTSTARPRKAAAPRSSGRSPSSPRDRRGRSWSPACGTSRRPSPACHPCFGWFADPARRLVAIEEEIDTATDPGRLAAIALASIGNGENERLSARTRRGLEAARSKGKGRAGAAVADVPELRERILRMRAEGMTLQAIADTLNEEGVPTLRGGAKWRPSSVHTATGYRRPAPARGSPPARRRSRTPEARAPRTHGRAPAYAGPAKPRHTALRTPREPAYARGCVWMPGSPCLAVVRRKRIDLDRSPANDPGRSGGEG